MKLELDEIIDRVVRTERDRAVYKMMADTWESMYNLEAFNESREAALRDNREQVVSPEPYNVINLALRLLPPSPMIEVPAETIDEGDENDAEARKRFLMGLWQRSSRDQGINLIKSAGWQGATLGRFVFDIRWVKDELPKRLRDRRCPILIRTLDPRNVGIKKGPLYTLWAYHKYREEKALARSRYPDIDWGFSLDETSDEAHEVEIIDFWYTDPKDGSIWNCILVDQQFAEEPYKTDYVDIPIVEGGCDPTPSTSEGKKYHSILHGLNGLWQYHCRLLSQKATGLLWYFWPAITVRSKTGQAPKGIEIGPGITTPLPNDTEVDVIQFNVNVPMADAMTQELQMMSQQSTFPGVMYGEAPGQIQAGFAVSILADAASGRIDALRQSLEQAMQTVNEIALGMVEEFGGKDGVPVWGKNEADDEVQTIVLNGDQVNGYYENLVNLKPQIPNDQIQKQTIGLRLVETGIISRETFRQKYADIELPSNEEKRVLWEQMAFAEGSPLSELIKDAAVAEKLGAEDWKLRLMEYQAIQQMQAQEMQRQIQAIMGPPPAPPQPPMPPQGPPMPPGMPPPPMGGPPMPPPRQGGDLPPQSIQPQQGIPMSPLPPEMMGQISPEMLGLPPGTPPEVFQAALNQLMATGSPTMDELRAMGGM